MVKTPRLAVFGGSGKTGRELIAVALKKGVLVRALYRPGSEPSQTPGLEIITGQLTEPGDIRRTIEGTDGAILVFGPRLGRHAHPEPFCAGATSRIIAEMKRLGIERLICQTGAMAGGDTPNWSKMVRMFVARYRKQYPAINLGPGRAGGRHQRERPRLDPGKAVQDFGGARQGARPRGSRHSHRGFHLHPANGPRRVLDR